MFKINTLVVLRQNMPHHFDIIFVRAEFKIRGTYCITTPMMMELLTETARHSTGRCSFASCRLGGHSITTWTRRGGWGSVESLWGGHVT